MRGSGTELGRVRGMGSAHTGAHHWLAQRLTAIANLGLVLWFIASLLMVNLGDHKDVVGWLRQASAAVPMMLLLVSVFYHVRLGLQVLIEDYVHGPALKYMALTVLTFLTVGGAAAGIFFVARIAFGAAA